MLEKTHENPLDSEENEPVNPIGNKPWIFLRKTDADAPVLWPPDAKSQPVGKDPDAGEDWGQEEKGVTEDEMVGWHHWLNGCECEQAPKIQSWAEKPGMLRSMGSQRAGCRLVTEPQQPPRHRVALCSSSGAVTLCFLHLGAPVLDACYSQIPHLLDELTPLLYNDLCLLLQSLD